METKRILGGFGLAAIMFLGYNSKGLDFYTPMESRAADTSIAWQYTPPPAPNAEAPSIVMPTQYGQPIAGDIFNSNHTLLIDETRAASACDIQDPDSPQSNQAVCNKANADLRALSKKGICLGGSNGGMWVTCKPGSAISREYMGKGMSWIYTKASALAPSEKIPDPSGRLANVCKDGVVESSAFLMQNTIDPYALKDHCFAMPVPSFGNNIQWVDESTMLVLPSIPEGSSVLLESPGHPKLGKVAVFIGVAPEQYQTTLGFTETPVTLRLLQYKD